MAITYTWNDESPSKDVCCCASVTVVAKPGDPTTPPATRHTARMMVADKATYRITLSAHPSESNHLKHGPQLRG